MKSDRVVLLRPADDVAHSLRSLADEIEAMECPPRNVVVVTSPSENGYDIRYFGPDPDGTCAASAYFMMAMAQRELLIWEAEGLEEIE